MRLRPVRPMGLGPKSLADRELRQEQLCKRFEVPAAYVDDSSVLGVSRGVFAGEWPINGQRYPAASGESGWYIWSGTEFSESPDFFAPNHSCHVLERRPELLPYLGLPAGWRFLIAPGYEDVWFDDSLLR